MTAATSRRYFEIDTSTWTIEAERLKFQFEKLLHVPSWHCAFKTDTTVKRTRLAGTG